MWLNSCRLFRGIRRVDFGLIALGGQNTFSLISGGKRAANAAEILELVVEGDEEIKFEELLSGRINFWKFLLSDKSFERREKEEEEERDEFDEDEGEANTLKLFFKN